MSFQAHFHTLHQRQLAKRSGDLEIQLNHESKLLLMGAHQKKTAAHLLTTPNADIPIMPSGFPLFHPTLMSSPRPNSIDASCLPLRQTAMYLDFLLLLLPSCETLGKSLNFFEPFYCKQ